MNLLAEFYSQPGLQNIKTEQPLHELIPRLWPMLRHTSPNVRTATLKTVEKLVGFLAPVLPEAMAHIFQTILIDEREDIIEAAFKVWNTVLKTNSGNAIRMGAFNFVSLFFPTKLAIYIF